jgi:hypothetical protein
MSAIILKSGIPDELVALSAEAIEERDGLVQAANHVLAPVDGAVIALTDETYPTVAQLVKDLDTFAKTVETQRETINRPILTLGRELMAAAKAAIVPAEAARQKLLPLVNTYEAIQRARVEEEKRKAREEAARLEQEERDRQIAAAKAKAELEAEPGEEPKPVDVAEVKVRPVLPAKVETFKGSTKKTVKQKASIVDASKIPFEVVVNGKPMRVWKEPDLKAIETLLKAGIDVPGCELVSETSYGGTGR